MADDKTLIAWIDQISGGTGWTGVCSLVLLPRWRSAMTPPHDPLPPRPVKSLQTARSFAQRRTDCGALASATAARSCAADHSLPVLSRFQLPHLRLSRQPQRSSPPRSAAALAPCKSAGLIRDERGTAMPATDPRFTVTQEVLTLVSGASRL
jgi:hypothetical protein